MAMDPSQILQMLLQGGGGSPAISPTSGLQDPSLSGLTLGPQGMGLSGGDSLMGGGAAGFGGGFGGGAGLDMLQLLSQLTGDQGPPARSQALGQMFAPSFGAGGQLGPTQLGGAPSGTLGQQAGGSASQATGFLNLLKEGIGVGKALSQVFPKGATGADITNLTQTLPNMPPDIQSALSGVVPLGGQATIPTGSGAFDLSQVMTPAGPSTFGLGQLMTAAGPSVSGPALGPAGAAALPGELGPAGEAIPAMSPSLLSSLGGLPGVLGGAGLASNLGFGALNLSQGNIGAGLGNILGTGAGVATGLALAPETFGLSLLLGGLGGGAGGLLGGLFGGGGPSEAWRSFAPRLAGTLGSERNAASNFVQAILNAKTPQDLEEARQTFLGSVEAGGVGGFASRSMPPGWVVPELPGATGTAHEGGLLWNPNAFNSYLNSLYVGARTALQDPQRYNLAAFQQGFIPLLQQSLQAPGGNTFGASPLLGLASPPPPLPPPAASLPLPSVPSTPPPSFAGTSDEEMQRLLRLMGVA